MSEVCTRCGGASHVAHGRRECVASWESEESTTPWTVGVCQPCGLKDLAEDRRKTTRVAPVKGLVLTILGLGTGMAAFISLQDPGWEKLWAVLFLLLAVPAPFPPPGRPSHHPWGDPPAHHPSRSEAPEGHGRETRGGRARG